MKGVALVALALVTVACGRLGPLKTEDRAIDSSGAEVGSLADTTPGYQQK